MFTPIENIRDVYPFDPFKAIVSPRPIGWISTVSKLGIPNLAPYSFFNAISTDPNMLGFTSSGIKDTLINCQDTGQFVFNVVSHNLLEAMNLTSAALAADHNEFEYAHLGQVPSVRVRPSRVEGTPAALECKVVDIFRLKDLDGKETNSWFTIGQVVGVFIDPAYITSQGRFDTAKAQIPGRCGYFDYSSSDRIFELLRP